MPADRIKRVNELLKREVASMLYHLSTKGELDLSLVTVTQVTTSKDLRHARVSVSVRGDENNRKAVFKFLYQHRKEFQQGIASNITLKYTPHLQFEFDDSIKAGDEILHIISELEATHPEWEKEPDSTHEPTPDESS